MTRVHALLAASLLLCCVSVDVARAQTPGASDLLPPPPVPNPTESVPEPPAPPEAAPPVVTADVLLGFLQDQATTHGVACALSTTYRVGDRVAIACGPSGVWIARIETNGTLSLVSRQHVGAGVVRLFEGDGRLWAELQSGGAVRVDPSDSTPTAQPSTSATTPTNTPSANAPATDTAATNAGTPLSSTPTPVIDTTQYPGNNRPWNLRDGNSARKRFGGIWEVSSMVRPFLALGTLGVGAVIDASVGYRFEAPIHVWASLQPFAPATGTEGPMSPFVALVLASYDTRNFELGLGVGGQKVNLPADAFDVNGNTVGPGTGITVSQFARMGDRDGLMVSIRSDIVLFRQKFQLSNVFVHGQLPLRSDQPLWVIVNGGGGTTGYALGEVGLRTRLKGDGGAGSVFLDVTVGGTSVFFEDVCDDTTFDFDRCSPDYSGPLLGIGADWRI